MGAGEGVEESVRRVGRGAWSQWEMGPLAYLVPRG